MSEKNIKMKNGYHLFPGKIGQNKKVIYFLSFFQFSMKKKQIKWLVPKPIIKVIFNFSVYFLIGLD